MKKEVSFILHPCFPKTGTTTFQNIINNLDVNILAKPSNYSKLPWFNFFKEISNDKKNKKYKEIDINSTKIFLFKDYIKKKIRKDGEILVYSDEGFFGKHYYNLDNIIQLKDIIKEIEIEEDICFNLKLIFTIRNPVNYIKSNYNYFSSINNKYTFKELIENIQKNNIEVRKIFKTSNVIEFCSKNFSKKILILPLELYIKEPKIYIDRLINFLQLDFSKYENTNHLSKIKLNINQNFGKKHNKIKGVKSSILYNFVLKVYLFFFKDSFFMKNKFMNHLKNTFKNLNYKIEKTDVDIDMYDETIGEIYKSDIIWIEKEFKVNLKKFDYYK